MKQAKLTSLFLALLMTLTLLAACEKKEDKAEKEKELFGAKEYTTIETVKGEPWGTLKSYGEKLFFLSRDFDRDNELVTYYLNKVTHGGVESELLVPRGEYASGFDIDADGNIVFIKSSSGPEDGASDADFVLKTVASDGTVADETNIKEELAGHTSENFYPESVAVDSNGNIIINNYDGIIVLDKNKKYLFDIPVSGGVRRFIKASGEIYAQTYGSQYNCELRKIDIDKKALSENIDVVQGYEMSYNLSVYGGEKGLYVSDKTCLYSFDTETNEKTEILNFSDAGVPGYYIRDVIADGDGFICVGYSETDKKTFIAKISPVDPSEITNKTEVVLAGSEYSIGSQLENQVIKFNSENDRYRIKIKKYSGDDFDEKLGLDMAAGNIPDILISDAYTQFESYAQKGLFADLYEFIDNDSELKREDFLPNLLTAMETDGKLLRFCPEFKIFTAIGKASIFGKESGLDFDRLDEILKSRPEGTEIFKAISSAGILDTAMQLCGDEFIDYKSGKCYFTSDYFLKLLEFADKFPETVDYQSMDGDLLDGFADDRSLMIIIYLTNFSDIFWNEHQIFGEETTAVGFPSFSGTGSSFDIAESFSISARSENKDGAWEFIRTLLKKEYQDKTEEFPVRLDSLKEKAAREAVSFDPDETRILSFGDMMYGINGDRIKEKMTEADIDKVMNVINSTVSANRYDAAVMEIITEEAGAYFSGARSAAEAAENMQNRVQTYLSELK